MSMVHRDGVAQNGVLSLEWGFVYLHGHDSVWVIDACTCRWWALTDSVFMYLYM